MEIPESGVDMSSVQPQLGLTQIVGDRLTLLT